MPSCNIVIICGNLTRDPEARTIPSGTTVCDLALAINDSYRNKAGEAVEQVCYVDVSTWGKTAENCAQYLRKGSPVLVEGKLTLDTWEKDGQKRSKLRVQAMRVQFLGKPAERAPSASAPPPDDQDPF